MDDPILSAQGPPAPVFNIDKLHMHATRRMHEKQKLYNRILARVHRRIETAAVHNTSCAFQIPEYVFGMPLYDAHQCAGYVLQKLQCDGFSVMHCKNNILYIDWREARSKRSKPSPTPPAAGGGSAVAPMAPLSKTSLKGASPNFQYLPTGKLFQ